MDSEDNLKEKAIKDLAQCAADWKDQLNRAVENAKRQEQQLAQQQIGQVKQECKDRIDELKNQMQQLNDNIQGLQKELKVRDFTIQAKDTEIAQ